MTLRHVALLAAVVLAGPTTPTFAQQGKTPPKIVRDSKSYADTVAILRVLQMQINTPKDLREGMTLAAALEVIDERSKAADTPLTIIFDYASLRKDKDFDEVYEGKLPPPKFYPLPARITLKMLLDTIVAQSPGATYVIRQGRIDVVNVQDATAKHLIGQPVLAAFDQRPLHEVLNDLSDLTGLSINLDANVGDKANLPISAVFRNNVALEDALTNVTEMAGLKFVVLPQSVYVTTSTSAAALAKDLKSRQP